MGAYSEYNPLYRHRDLRIADGPKEYFKPLNVGLLFFNDNPETLYCKTKKLAINKLVEIIKKYQNNEYIPRSSQDIHIGKQYKTEDRNIKTAIIYYIKQIKRMLKK